MTAEIADPLQGSDPLGILGIPSFVNLNPLVQSNKVVIGIPNVDTSVRKDFLDRTAANDLLPHLDRRRVPQTTYRVAL